MSKKHVPAAGRGIDRGQGMQPGKRTMAGVPRHHVGCPSRGRRNTTDGHGRKPASEHGRLDALHSDVETIYVNAQEMLFWLGLFGSIATRAIVESWWQAARGDGGLSDGNADLKLPPLGLVVLPKLKLLCSLVGTVSSGGWPRGISSKECRMLKWETGLLPQKHAKRQQSPRKPGLPTLSSSAGDPSFHAGPFPSVFGIPCSKFFASGSEPLGRADAKDR